MNRTLRCVIFSGFAFMIVMLGLAQPPAATTGFYNLSKPGSSAAAENVLKANLLEQLSPGLRDSPVATAYLDALGILEEKGTCSDFFGGSDAATLVLKELVTNLEEVPLKDRDVGMRMFGEIVIVKNMRLNFTYRTFEKAIVNTKGPFFRSGGNWKHVGSFTSSSREARALMLLHELAHMIKKPKGDYLIADDGKGTHPMLGFQNSKIIEAACRAPLLALKRKPQLNLQELAKLILEGDPAN